MSSGPSSGRRTRGPFRRAYFVDFDVEPDEDGDVDVVLEGELDPDDALGDLELVELLDPLAPPCSLLSIALNSSRLNLPS